MSLFTSNPCIGPTTGPGLLRLSYAKSILAAGHCRDRAPRICFICSPLHGRACRWAMLGKLKTKGPKAVSGVGRSLLRRFCGPSRLLGPLDSSSSQHRRTPELVLQKDHASFRITSGPPVQSIAVSPRQNRCHNRGTSLIRNYLLLGPYSRTMPREP